MYTAIEVDCASTIRRESRTGTLVNICERRTYTCMSKKELLNYILSAWEHEGR